MHFGRLRIISVAPKKGKARQTIWLCQCDCGRQKEIRSDHIKSGLIQSCGCLRKELTRERSVTHGKRFSKIYGVWRTMLVRCSDPKHNRFAHYGGRGIRVCERWKKFENFLADMGESSPGYSIDRINNNGDYAPSNCRWATASEQQRNRRSQSKILLDPLTLKE
jgi:hypothetical protein